MSPQELAAILGGVALVISPFLGWWTARTQGRATRADVERRMSGQVHTTDADRLWEEGRKMREELQGQLLAQARNHREDLDRLDGELQACVEKHRHADLLIAQLQEDGRSKDRRIEFLERINERLDGRVKSLGETLLAYQRQYGALASIPIPETKE